MHNLSKFEGSSKPNLNNMLFLYGFTKLACFLITLRSKHNGKGLRFEITLV